MLDVAIIGGGVCGCSLLYALAGYRLNVALFEKTNDVGVATTKANSAIVHAGYDPAPGTLMARFNVAGSALVKALCQRLDILYKQTGSLVVAFSEAERPHLDELLARGQKNGVPGLEIVEGEALQKLEPGLSPEAKYALFAPTAAVVNPWELAFAQAEAAVQNGARVFLDSPVTAIAKTENSFTLQTPAGPVEARFVVNCAGVESGHVAALCGDDSIEILPNRGQYFLLDKSQANKARHVIFQVPTAQGKGVLVAPTVHGNLICGPNAEDAEDTATTTEGLAHVRERALASVPGIQFGQSIRNFSGLRAVAKGRDDFIVQQSDTLPGLFHAAGIKSPGLSAAPAIALHLVELLHTAGLPLDAKPDFDPQRRIKRFSHMTEAERRAAIEENPLYGRIVCRCETVTEGEVVDALHRPLPPRSLDAVKRRCGPGMGRCQGGFCGPRVQAIIARELGLHQADVPQDRTGMYIVTGRTKQEGGEADG